MGTFGGLETTWREMLARGVISVAEYQHEMTSIAMAKESLLDDFFA